MKLTARGKRKRISLSSPCPNRNVTKCHFISAGFTSWNFSVCQSFCAEFTHKSSDYQLSLLWLKCYWKEQESSFQTDFSMWLVLHSCALQVVRVSAIDYFFSTSLLLTLLCSIVFNSGHCHITGTGNNTFSSTTKPTLVPCSGQKHSMAKGTD